MDSNSENIRSNKNYLEINLVENNIRLSLNKEQKIIFDECSTYIHELAAMRDGAGTKPNPLRLLIHGGPGTGKSHLIHQLDAQARQSGFTTTCMASTGMAAYNLPNGRTVHSSLSIPINYPFAHYLPELGPIKKYLSEKDFIYLLLL